MTVATITLNRPDALNALNAALLKELCQALESADANDKVRCILITGSEKAFAAGADITEMSEQSFVDMYTKNYFAAEVTRFNSTRKPIIAAVSGYALGGGCELAMMCDFIIAVGNSQIWPTRDQSWRYCWHRRDTAVGALCWQIQSDGYEPDRAFHGCRRGGTIWFGQSCGACE